MNCPVLARQGRPQKKWSPGNLIALLVHTVKSRETGFGVTADYAYFFCLKYLAAAGLGRTEKHGVGRHTTWKCVDGVAGASRSSAPGPFTGATLPWELIPTLAWWWQCAQVPDRLTGWLPGLPAAGCVVPQNPKLPPTLIAPSRLSTPG